MPLACSTIFVTWHSPSGPSGGGDKCVTGDDQPELSVGQVVGLDWAHVYVTDPETGSKWPERIVTKLAE